MKEIKMVCTGNLADIEAVFSDIDGTLLNTHGELSERTKKAVQNLPIPFILTSGRSIKMIESLYKDLELTTPRITSNGAVIYGRHEVIIAKTYLRKAAIADLVSIMTERSNHSISMDIFSLDTWYCNELMGNQSADIYRMVGATPDLAVKDLSRLPMGKMVKFLAFGKKEELDLYENYCRKNYASEFTILHDNPVMLEIFPIRSSKGTAVKEVCRYLRIKPKNVLGIGDTDMDVELLKACGYRAALENSNDKVKNVADIFTLHTDQDGLAVLLEKITESKRLSFNQDKNR